MPNYCSGSRSIVLVGIFAAFTSASLPASAQFRDGFITLTEGALPFHVGVNPVTNRIFTSSHGNASDGGVVTVIDGATNGIIATVAVGAVAEDIVANPVTNRIYVGSFQSKTVAVIDGSDNTVIATVSVPDSPFSIDVNPVTNRVYSRGSQSVSVLDGFTNTVIATIPVDGGSRGLVVDPATNRIFISDGPARAIVVVDGATNAIIDTVTLGDAQPRGLGVDPATNRLYIAAGLDVIVLDTATMAVIAEVPVEGFAMAVALNPLTNRLYVRTESGGVAAFNTLTNTVVRTFAVTDIATNSDIEVNPVTNALYVPMAQIGVVWVEEDPTPVGGRDFGISVVSNGVQLTWTSGTKETGYSILRWAGDKGDTLETIANLAKGRTSFVDRNALTESAYNYALVPLDAAGSSLWVSDIVGVRPNSQSAEHAPANFTLRHTAHAHHNGQIGFGVELSWRAPGDQAGYVLAAWNPNGSQEVPLSAATNRLIEVISEPSGFTLFASVGEEVGHTHALYAMPLTWAMNNNPSFARKLTTRTTRGKSTKPIKRRR